MSQSNNKIAIVGIGCILPDANSPLELWNNTLRGHSAVRPLSARTYDWHYYQRDSELARRLFEQPIGAELDGHAFDWRRFKISPLDAQGINPMHLHVLEAGAQAIEDVRHVTHPTAGVFVGGTGLGWRRDSGLRIRLADFLNAAEHAGKSAGLSDAMRQRVLATVSDALDKKLRPVSDDGVVNSLASIAAGRLALRFDLRGPHAGIDAGFASGLAAVSNAARLLLDGTIDLALAGGASECISPLDLISFQQLSVLAPSHVRPFDVSAEGTLLGEGVVVFALKRLRDAIDHGERIYAVLCGTGAASDGHSKSLLAPSVDGQVHAMQRAYAEAEIDPNTVGYVECHATGTPVGDATEIHALARVFSHATHGIAVASAKPFVGHLRGASGAVGLLRAILALHNRTITAQINFERPHPNLELDSTPFFVPTEQLPLEPREGAPTARAAVSSFGLGGINYHAVLEAFEPEQEALRTRTGRTVSGGLPSARAGANEPIAIIGLGGVLPNADNVSAFWQSLVDGLDATRDVPRSRWQVDRYYDSDQKRLDASYTKIGCFVEPLPNPGKELRVPPIASEHIDPSHVIAFRAAQEAIADARLESGKWDRDRTAVILGFIPCQGRRHLAEARLNFREFEHELEQVLLSSGADRQSISQVRKLTEQEALASIPAITEDTLPGFLGSFNAARIARHFDLHGPHFTVESACASSLAALQAGARLLQQGAADTIVLGGVWADGQPEFFVQNCRFSALSATAITPFDERASGFVPGEGAAVLVLRRLNDAERDGQRIHAVIRSIEGSTDGAAGRSIYSPSAEGESLAARRALEAAAVDPTHVDYVECHGTGTALGDVVEIEACTHAYGSGRERPLLVGSVKSNIGHLMAGAGAAALLKTTLAIREGIIPASLKVEKLNPKIDFQTGPVEVVTQTRNWIAPSGQPRRAGVSGFGLGGTNFHAIVEQYQRPSRIELAPGSSRAATRTSRRLVPIAAVQGRDVASCVQAMKAIANRARGCDVAQFSALLAANQATAAGDALYRVAIVAEDPGVLMQRTALLETAFAKRHDLSILRAKGVFCAEADPTRRAAALFPGQGPQYANMLCEAAKAFPELSQSLDRIDLAYEAICGRKLRPSYCTDDPDTYSQSDEDIHCAVFGVNIALFELLRSFGAQFDAVMGQSAGELSALVATGSITIEDGLRAVRERTLSVLGIHSADPGRMVTLSCGADHALRLIRDLPGYAALAADNGPSACIVSGNRQAVDVLLERAGNEGIRATVLAVSHGYHSQLIAAARPRYREALDRIRFRPPSIDLYSTITGASIEGMPPQSFGAHLESQFVEPVRLQQAVTALYLSGVRVFVECGPKWPLTTFVSEILNGLPYVAQATVHPKVGEVEQLNRALACLFVHRVCSLAPVKELPMSVLSSPVSETSVTATAVTEARPHDGRAAALISTLRAVRDLIDQALNAYANPSPEHHEPEASPSTAVRSGIDADGPAPHSEVESSTLRDSDVISHPIASPLADTSSARVDVEERLIAQLVARTGYPEDMLEPDLDLEAELGIDTVKQVASLAAVREHFGLAPDPTFRMQDARTLRQAVDYLVSRISGAASSTMPQGTAPRAQQPPTSPQGGSSVSNARATRPTETTTATPTEQLVTAPSETKLRATAGVEAIAPLQAPTAEARDSITVAARLDAIASPAAPIANTRDSMPAADTGSEQVARLLISELMTRTGYPEDMLELDLDLEAELGIDTVKQVAALAAVREKLGLPQDPKFRMQDARTLRQAISYLTSRLQSKSSFDLPHAASLAPSPQTLAAPPPPHIDPQPAGARQDFATSASVPQKPTSSTPEQPIPSASEFATALNELREYVKSLALLVTQGLRHTSGGPSPQPAVTAPPPGPEPRAARTSVTQTMVPRSVYPEVLLESILPQAGCPWNGEALEVTGLAIADNQTELPAIESNRADVTPLQAHDAAGHIVARSRHVRLVNAGTTASARMLDAVKEGHSAASAKLLHEYLTKCGREHSSSIEWAYSQGFTTTVGGGRVPKECLDSRAMLSLLGSCFDVASFAWFGLTGALHSLSGIDRICFHRVPQPGDEILICARMVQPKGGFWRADVTAFDPSGGLYAELSGMEGVPLPSNGVSEDKASDPAERAWRRFAERMGRDSVAPEEIAS